MKKKNEMKG